MIRGILSFMQPQSTSIIQNPNRSNSKPEIIMNTFVRTPLVAAAGRRGNPAVNSVVVAVDSIDSAVAAHTDN